MSTDVELMALRDEEAEISARLEGTTLEDAEASSSGQQHDDDLASARLERNLRAHAGDWGCLGALDGLSLPVVLYVLTMPLQQHKTLTRHHA